jgi:CopG family nickel-responsive transcriptional regulator
MGRGDADAACEHFPGRDPGPGFDQRSTALGYTSRPEAVRDLVRRAVDTEHATRRKGPASPTSPTLHNHQIRSLAQRLTDIAHNRHNLIVATMHAQLDHDTCLESVILKGEIANVRAYADNLRAERGVSFGELNLVSVEAHDGHHDHGHDAPSHDGSAHLTPVRAKG